MTQTPRLALPYIQPAQAQKHVTHNEGLRLLDALVQTVLLSVGSDTPPATPEEGETHATGTAPTGDWAGQPHRLAVYSGGAWQFVAPRDGWLAWDATAGTLRVATDGAWIAAATPESAEMLGINASADSTNRLTVASAATLLSHDGAGHQVKINKAASADTASLLFQSAWSGRAEMGLAGSDAFAIKVSADGSDWFTAMTCDPATGHAGFGITAPERPIHLSDALRIEPGSAPASPAAGDLYFDAGAAVLRCHDGTAWRDLF